MPSPVSFAAQPEVVQVSTALEVLRQINLLRESNSLSLDIGGSLAKLIYLQPKRQNKPSPPPLKIHQVDGAVTTALSVDVPSLNGTLHFFAFETRNIHLVLRFIAEKWPESRVTKIRATGGGSYKYERIFREQIGVRLVRLDEMACTVAGLNFLLTSVNQEVYFYPPPATRSPLPAGVIERQFIESSASPFPYLLVNIGSGVSIVKVVGHDQFQRVSGSALGGGTFWGLAKMLFDCNSFDEIIELTHDGDNSKVDMLVGDIYGGAYQNIGLDPSIIAASFGKATMRDDNARHQTSTFSLMKYRFVKACLGTLHLWLSFFRTIPPFSTILRALSLDRLLAPPALTKYSSSTPTFKPEDIALSLLRMVSYNLAQIAYLNARVHNLDTIYFGGNFIRDHPYTIADISFAVDFWSGGKMKAFFLRHDGYLGAIGAFIGASSAAPRTVIEEPVKVTKKKEPAPENGRFDLPNGDIHQPRDQSTAGVLNEAGVKKRKRKKGSVDSEVNKEEISISNGMNGVPGSEEEDGDWTTVTRTRRKHVVKSKDKGS